MAIFQKSIVNKYLKNLDNEKVTAAHQLFKTFYGSKLRLHNIINLKEENYQEGFLREIFVQVLGYTINPDLNYNLTTEYKNQNDSKKADGAILRNNSAIGVIELKSTKTQNLETIKNQAFNYKHNQPDCRYVITSNFQNLRFYIDNSIDYEEFSLFELSEDLNAFRYFYLILSQESIFKDLALKMKEETKFHEESITDKFYRDYKLFKEAIFDNLIQNNPQYDKLTLFKKSQKLLDRFLFVYFAEDSGLCPPNSVQQIIEQWKVLKANDAYFPLYSRFQKLFTYLDVGKTFETYEIPAYNGGLFRADELLDHEKTLVDDSILLKHCPILSNYDFSTEIDVNILGHIFEHSLNEIEEITAELKGEVVEKSKTKRKKDGIFYTPDYITNYIIENTIGKLCIEKQTELGLTDFPNLEGLENLKDKKGKPNKDGKLFFEQLQSYKQWLFTLKILDPACGSGAFLNAALGFLIREHQQIDSVISELSKDKARIFDTDKAILEKNIFGVDINDESVEIAKLSLWLRTAKKDRTLSDLNDNIKCGNSLIDNPEIAGEKAFDWNTEFPDIMKNGGFDVIIGNPPYGVKFNAQEKKYLQNFDKTVPDYEIYIYFISLGLDKILKSKGIITYIFPNTFLSRHFGATYRGKLLDNFSINSITNLSADFTFVDASVRTCIVSIQKELRENNRTELWQIETLLKRFELQNTVDKTFLQENIINWLNFFKTTNHQQNLITKLQQNPSLGEFFEVSQGFIPYRRSDLIKVYGEEEGNKIVDKRLWHSNKKLNEEYKQELLGKDIMRYAYKKRKLFVKYGKHIAGYVNPKYFTQNRILIREISDRNLVCNYLEEEFYTSCSLISVIQSSIQQLDLKYLLAMLNSKIIGWYHNQTSPKAQKGLFPKILINDVRKLPIKNADSEQQQRIIVLVDKMLGLKKTFYNQLEEFTHRLEMNFDKLKITEKITTAYRSDFKTILAEFAKQKVRIKIGYQKEWELFFAENQGVLLELEEKINGLEMDLQLAVYQLYELTPEEIAVIERKE